MLHKNCLIMFWIAGHLLLFFLSSVLLESMENMSEGWPLVSSSMCKESNKRKQVHDGERASKGNGGKIDGLDAILWGLGSSKMLVSCFVRFHLRRRLFFCIYWSNKIKGNSFLSQNVSECSLEDLFFVSLSWQWFIPSFLRRICVCAHKFARQILTFLTRIGFVGGWHRSSSKGTQC